MTGCLLCTRDGGSAEWYEGREGERKDRSAGIEGKEEKQMSM
jgi:hypothetical protein